MPVIVIGADTEVGHAIIHGLRPASGELRAFVSDADVADSYRQFAKVAIGDLSDGSHVGGAALGAFCAIVIAAAAHDGRDRYFAQGMEELFSQWADGLADAGIGRVIVVGTPEQIPKPDPLQNASPDYHHADTTGRSLDEIVAVVAEQEAAR
jgi:putative NADH-flavin reductase